MSRPRIYELALVVEPRQSDSEVEAIIDRYKTMIEEGGGTVTEVENWGKRKLAFPIQKYNEGKYVFLHVTAETSPPWTDIERLLMQSEQILRHLVVRTDLDKKRAETRAKRRKPRNPLPEHLEESRDSRD